MASAYSLGQEAALQKLGMPTLGHAMGRLNRNKAVMSAIGQAAGQLVQPVTAVGSVVMDAARGAKNFLGSADVHAAFRVNPRLATTQIGGPALIEGTRALLNKHAPYLAQAAEHQVFKALT